MMQLTPHLLAEARRYKKTPFLLTDLQQVSCNYHRLTTALPGTVIHYAVKSNNDLRLLNHLHRLGSHFDVASWSEIQTLLKLGVPPSHLVFGAPIKKPNEINRAYQAGIRCFTFDSEEELSKIQSAAPQSRVILRLVIDGHGSQCPMHRKFGVAPHEAISHLRSAQKLHLHPFGLTFHVGSQCTSQQSWQAALTLVSTVWQAALESAIPLEVLDLGGGLPVAYHQEIPPLEVYTQVVQTILHTHFPHLTTTYIEPGRYMTDNASVMVSSIIGMANRPDAHWLFLDVGGFNGLFEVFEKFKYDLKAAPANHHPLKTYSVAGPTCDGMDIIRHRVRLPDVKIGDRLYIMNAGAYSTSLQTYNGHRWPHSHIIT